MCCIQIQMIDVSNVPTEFLGEHGELILDTFSASDYNIKFEDGELTVDGFRVDTAFEIAIPKSPKNNLALSSYITEHRYQASSYIVFDVNIIACGGSLNFKFASIDYEDYANYYLVASTGSNHPLTLMKGCNLCEVDLKDFSEFIITDENVSQQKIKLINGYEEGLSPYHYPEVIYGRTENANYISAIDLRPWYHPLALIKLILCSKGWDFKSPLFEDIEWKHKWVYVSGEDYGTKNVNLDDYKFQFALENPVDIRPVNEDGTLIDDGGFLGFGENNYGEWDVQPLTRIYDGLSLTFFLSGNLVIVITPDMIQDFHFDFTIRIHKNIINSYKIEIVAIGLEGSDIEGQELASDDLEYLQGDVDTDDPNYRLIHGTLTVGSDLFKYSIEANQAFKIVIRANGDTNGLFRDEWGNKIPQLTKAVLYNTPIRARYKLGDSIPMADTLSCEHTAYDLFEGICHIGDFKIDIDWVTQTLTLFPAFGYNSNGVDIEGYYKEDEFIDLSDHVICNSRSNRNPNKLQKRHHIFGFKETTDPLFNSKYDFSNEYQLHDKKIDFGDDFDEGITISRNPFFEATLVDYVSFSIPSTYPLKLPILSDNTEGKRSFKIAPRIMQSYFKKYQVHHTPEQDYYSLIAFGKPSSGLDLGELVSSLYHNYYLERYTPTIIFSLGDEDVPISAYGDFENDHWTKYIGRQYVGRFINNTVTIGIYIDCLLLHNLDKRVQFRMNTDRGFVFGYLNELDVSICSKQGQLTINAPNEVKGLCFERPTAGNGNDDDFKCNNSPQLRCEKVGDCYLYTIEGSFDSIIELATWEYEVATLDDDGEQVFSGNYEFMEVISPISAQLCNPMCQFRVRAKIDWMPEEINGQEITCPPTTKTHSKDPCGNSPEIEIKCFTNEECNNCFVVKVLGENPSLISSIDAVANSETLAWVIDSSQMSATSIEVCISESEFILESLEITWLDGCKTWILPEAIEKEYTLNCDQFKENSIECYEVNGCCMFRRTGITVCEDKILDQIIFRGSNDDGVTWTEPCVWKGEPICEFKRVQGMRILDFCDIDCEPIKTCWIECGAKDIDCNCVPVGSCSDCLYQFTEDCGASWVWYDMRGWTDQNSSPNGLSIKEIQDYPKLGPLGVLFHETHDQWYIAIGSKAGCEDYILSYFHDVFVVPQDEFIPPEFNPRPE